MRQLIDTTAGSPFIVENGVVRMTDAFMTNMVAMNAFIENLTAKNIDTRKTNEQGEPYGQGLTARSAYKFGGDVYEVDGYGSTGDKAFNLIFGAGSGNGVEPELRLFKDQGRAFLNTTGLNFGFGAFYGRSGITLPNTATVDMPGVALCIGTANKHGSVTEQWGAVHCDGQRSTEGERHYTITHNLNHTNYHLDVVPHRKSDGWCAISYTMVTKGTHSTVFAIVYSDSNVPAEVGFEFQLTGKNKV